MYLEDEDVREDEVVEEEAAPVEDESPAEEEAPVEDDGKWTHYVPRYIAKDENGRKFQTDNASDGEVVCDLRPE